MGYMVHYSSGLIGHWRCVRKGRGRVAASTLIFPLSPCTTHSCRCYAECVFKSIVIGLLDMCVREPQVRTYSSMRHDVVTVDGIVHGLRPDCCNVAAGPRSLRVRAADVLQDQVRGLPSGLPAMIPPGAKKMSSIRCVVGIGCEWVQPV